jgi:hypothetical protein
MKKLMSERGVKTYGSGTSPKILYPRILDRVTIKQAMVRNAR